MTKHIVCNVPVTIGVTISDLSDAVVTAIHRGGGLIVTFVNPHASFLARDAGYVDRLRKFDYVLCDGAGMALAARYAFSEITERLSFDSTSVAPVVFRICRDLNVPVFLVGGKPGVAENAAAVFKRLYPGIVIQGVASGYGDDPEQARSTILAIDRMVVIAGFGAPRQEDYLLSLRLSGWRGVGFTCGGYFDQVGVDGVYYPDFINKYNLRFLYRLYREPRRLWRRYFVEYQDFVSGFMVLILKKVFGVR